MNRTFNLVLATCLVVFTQITFAPFVSGAVVVIPDVQVEVGVEGDTMNLSPVGTEVPGPGDLFNYVGAMSAVNWDFNWDMTVDPDPLISAVFGLTNNTAITQTFIVSVSMPIAPTVVPSSVIGGSMGLTVTDSNGNGVGTVTSAAPSPVYEGQIDGAGVLPLLPDPFSISVPFAGGTAVTSVSAGLPGPTIPGPPAFATIGILHKFTLTPGDSIGLTSFFIVEAVPEPSSLALGSLALLAMVGTMRRRRK